MPLTTRTVADTPDDLVIIGDRGRISFEKKFFMATKAEMRLYGKKGQKFQQKHRSGGFEYQIEEAMACIRAGKIESPVMPHADSLANMQVMDEIRAQIGVKYPFE